MANYTFEWLGWCSEDNHDKVWGYICIDNRSYYNFWGERGKSLRFKRHSGAWDLKSLTRAKVRKGYVQQTENDMERIYPAFKEHFDRQFVMAKFSGSILTDDMDNTSFM